MDRESSWPGSRIEGEVSAKKEVKVGFGRELISPLFQASALVEITSAIKLSPLPSLLSQIPLRTVQ
jgi:hypothetical protein